ncbi:MAG: hypothetical protein SRB2_03087 [Desulfobacteraceae bacterium Eth-SRB2]|nr:MAG: hypothetical protein SRB2_03087 [Desulfobacteraceae bacterium Eth-SRB2]
MAMATGNPQKLPSGSTDTDNSERDFHLQVYCAVSVAEIDTLKEKAPRPPAYIESDVAHPELFRALKDWRSLGGRKRCPFSVYINGY